MMQVHYIRTITKKNWWYFCYVGGFILLLLYSILQLPNTLANTDEATSILIGKLGLFGRDWTSYQAGNWYGGVVHIYPIITSLAYTIGGITGSRLVSIFSSLLVIEIILMLFIPKVKGLLLSSIFFLILIMYISSPGFRYFATSASYDMVSLYILLSGLWHFVAVYQKPVTIGKDLFTGAMLTSLAVLTNYHLIWAALLLLLFSYFLGFRHSAQYRFFWVRYVGYATMLVVIFWIITHLGHLPTLIFSVSVPLFADPNSKQLLPLTTALVLGLLITVTHVRWHMLTLKKKQLAGVVGLIVVTVLFQVRESLEVVSDSTELPKQIAQYFAQGTKPYDRILTESGPPLMIVTFAHTHPSRIATFNWFTYREKTGPEAYQKAVQDGFFHYIELKKPDTTKPLIQKNISDGIRSNLLGLYTKAYESEKNEIYKRNY